MAGSIQPHAPAASESAHSRVVVRQGDLDAEEATLVYAPLWPRDRRLPMVEVVVRRREGYVTEVLLLQVCNFAVYPLDGRLQPCQSPQRRL